jgi:small subunit ribosomal protein S6
LEEALLRIYEGMFVLDDARCSENWEAVAREVRGLLEKNQAEIFTCERWDERRLAYPVDGHTRAVYLLARFTAPTEAIHQVERDCQLNDTVIRVLIVRDLESERLHKAGLFPPRPEGEQPPEPDAPPPAEEAAQAPREDQTPPPTPEAAEPQPSPPPGEQGPAQGDASTQP